jgi:hypothetical protein
MAVLATSSGDTMASGPKESLLLSQMDATDEWAGWCTVESEPVIHRGGSLTSGDIQPIVMGHWCLLRPNTRNIFP